MSITPTSLRRNGYSARTSRPRVREPLIPPVPPPKRHPYDQWSPDARALDLVGDKWTLLIIRDLAAGPRRFVELQRVLPGISTEQLRSRLNRMVADGMLAPPAGLEGTVELIVEPDGEAPERKYLVTVSGGHAEISEVGGATPTASV